MSKKTTTINTKRGLIRLVSENRSKKGEIRGKNKHETKILKKMCPHHAYNKRGKIKQQTDVQGSEATCTMCGRTFRADPYTNSERKDLKREVTSFIDQTMFLTTALNGEEHTIRTVGEAAVSMDNVFAINKRANKLLAKSQKMGDKNKGKKKQSGSTINAWGTF